MSSSYIAAKVAGPVLAVAFLVTLKPLARGLAKQLRQPMRGAFEIQVEALTVNSGVGGGSLIALLVGCGVWIAASFLLDPPFGEYSTWIGAVLGLCVVYLYFLGRFYLHASADVRGQHERKA